MQIFREIEPLKAFLKDQKGSMRSVGFVPTMGALHAGHLSIVRASQAENDLTVCSIYVNPTQFNNPDDLRKYPRAESADIAMLESVGCDVIFIPDNAQMYEDDPGVTLGFGELEKIMEGKFRPGHFSGVALVVGKLFHIVHPNRAYFGQKDWQQFAILSRFVKELKFDIALKWVPTVREHDGLAMSSRNARLNEEERARASSLYRALRKAEEMLKQGSTVSHVQTEIHAGLEERQITMEYLELVDSVNLNFLKNVKTSDNPMLCIAAYVGEVRLIDNLFIDNEN